MNENHTNACGTEPFDHVYSLGYQVHHEDWSPFPRVNMLRQTFLDRPYEVDVERLRLVTESYKEHEVWRKSRLRVPKQERRSSRRTCTISQAPAIWPSIMRS